MLAKFFVFSITVICASAVRAERPFKDFAGTSCTAQQIVVIKEIGKKPINIGPVKGYVNVTVTDRSGEEHTGSFPKDLAQTLKVSGKACKATFADEL